MWIPPSNNRLHLTIKIGRVVHFSIPENGTEKIPIDMPITKETIDGKTVFFVDTNALIACFDPGITEELVKKLARNKPLRVIFRDDAFGSDSVKINVEQIFKLLSPGTEVKTI